MFTGYFISYDSSIIESELWRLETDRIIKSKPLHSGVKPINSSLRDGCTGSCLKPSEMKNLSLHRSIIPEFIDRKTFLIFKWNLSSSIYNCCFSPNFLTILVFLYLLIWTPYILPELFFSKANTLNSFSLSSSPPIIFVIPI